MQRLLAAIFVYATLVLQPLAAQTGGAASAPPQRIPVRTAMERLPRPTMAQPSFWPGGSETNCCAAVLCMKVRNIGGGLALTDFDEEAAAGYFSCERISHGCASVTSGFVACGFLLGAS
jgi:hypothetical protein